MRDKKLRSKATKIWAILKRSYPDAACGLNYSSALDLLVATILSAQCTDQRVNMVTGKIFLKYRRPEDYIAVPLETLEKDIHSTGFFRNKARAIQGAARILVTKHEGRVPGTMEELLELPGVGRKTANVVLGNAHGVPGITVDTHVGRVSRRLGLTDSRYPDRVERDLMSLIPKRDWTRFSHAAIFHGRQVCHSRKPRCGRCRLKALCPSRVDVAESGS